MTPGFWISSITVAGHPTRRDSSVSFESGLNVIYGPSNSGKSWVLQCIDYVFGLKADEFVLDENSGYTEVRMGVRTAQGSLTLSRPIGEGANNIEVSSTDPRIESGVYKRQSSGRSPLLSSVWLKLIGYDAPENLKIIKNQNLETQALTWRTFWHALYADEDRISTKKPILIPLQATAQPAFKCALASLITGKDYAAYARDESVETRKLRNNAIIDYLEPLPKQLEERIELIDKALGSSDPAEIQQRIDELTAELERVQQRITHATVQGITSSHASNRCVTRWRNPAVCGTDTRNLPPPTVPASSGSISSRKATPSPHTGNRQQPAPYARRHYRRKRDPQFQSPICVNATTSLPDSTIFVKRSIRWILNRRRYKNKSRISPQKPSALPGALAAC